MSNKCSKMAWQILQPKIHLPRQGLSVRQQIGINHVNDPEQYFRKAK